MLRHASALENEHTAPACLSYGAKGILHGLAEGYLTRIRNDAIMYTWNTENAFPSGFLLTCWKHSNSLRKRISAPSMERLCGYCGNMQDTGKKAPTLKRMYKYPLYPTATTQNNR